LSPQDFFDRLLLGGGCLVILDGLDEIVDQTERGHMRTQVERLANDIYADNHFIVTAREAGYRENAVFSDDFVRLDVQPLGGTQIRALVQNWCALLYAADAQTQTDEIFDAIATINARYRRRNLPPLVTTPLMTTMVISVKWGETELPRSRGKLYESAVRVVLQAQHLDEDATRDALINWGGAWEDQLLWLSHLALAMHTQGGRGAAVDEAGVRALLPKSMTPEQVDTFVRAVRLRGGLFEERGELFQFLHLTFQEFLAARLLAKQRTDAWPTLRIHVNDAWWREVFLLHYGFAKTDYPPYAQEFLDWLSTLPDADDATRLAGLELAVTAILEIERPEPALRRRQAERLTAFLFDPAHQTAPVQRAAAGVTLGQLGDPRRGVGLRRDGLPDIDWVPIAAGPFIMGSDKQVDPGAQDSETPQFTCHLITQPYRMARYPITVAQYACFVEADGYRERRFWTDAGWSWQVKEKIDGPREFRDRFQTPNHPQVGVSWYEAVAFCNWLSEALDREIRLPSEAEWERAARHTDGRVYPWSGDFAPERCNMNKTGIGATSAVGLFLNGAAESGTMDISGNVLEWCSTSWCDGYRNYEAEVEDSLDGDARRVLRGGSFSNNRLGVQCAFCFWFYPDVRVSDVGFRVLSLGL
jgi:formylglycine-generating enzyme required for sulfatase activity